jgi:Zn-dependent protease
MGFRPIHLATIAGIDVSLHPTWFLVALYEIASRSGAYTSIVWNVLELLALFLFVTMHEFGHALACRSVGGSANHILLWPFGGIAFVDTPQRPGATLWTLAAGPLVNVALVPVLALLAGLAGSPAAAGANLYVFVHTLVLINAGLLIFNLLPVYPLDGGQILRALLWYPMGRIRSLMAATVIGLAGVAGLFLLAALWRDLWLALISIFILTYCWNGLKQARAQWKLSRLPQHPGEACPWCQASPPAAELWRCAACQQTMDPFVSGGCPNCTARSQRVACPYCHHASPLETWAGAAAAAPVEAR